MSFTFPSLNTRTVLVGQTGCGKTTVARALLQFYQYVFVYDVKGMMRPQEWPLFAFVKTFDELRKAARQQKNGEFVYPKIVFQPRFEELPDETNLAPADRFFQYVYLRRHTVVYVDEVYGVTSNRKIPSYLKAILTRGRERGITAFMATQRPTEIPQFILSEAENFYVFKLQMPQDKKRIEEIKGIPTEQIDSLKKYEFLIANESEYSPTKRWLKL
jgi:ABC-type oligopeptide transport system ATPase subunit